MIKKSYVSFVVLLFIFSSFIPISIGIRSNQNNIITVDDEPGDADFTSINEALNYSSPGDIIKVYSGTYFEQELRIVNNNITLLGIAQELGDGNDSGKPFIKGNGIDKEYIIKVMNSYVFVSNFKIENTGGILSHYIRIGTDPEINSIRNITISDCIILGDIGNSLRRGIYIYQRGTLWNVSITNNCINNCRGIYYLGSAILADQKSCIISGNVISDSSFSGIHFDGMEGIISGNNITDCRDIGIEIEGNWNNISKNRIIRSEIGIQIRGVNNNINGNNIDSCSVGIQYNGDLNSIVKNNFKNYSKNGFWFTRSFGEQYNLLLKNKWLGNYWDTWIGVGPKIIFGLQAIPSVSYFYPILIPGFEFDWSPAKEPYDISI